jgi:hypothetical protein
MAFLRGVENNCPKRVQLEKSLLKRVQVKRVGHGYVDIILTKMF